MKNNLTKNCYVCGYELDEYPYYPDERGYSHPDENIICPCCGVHYGCDDEGAGKFDIPDELAFSDWKFADETHVKIIKLIRSYWINDGMKWKHNPESEFHPKPQNWDPVRQMVDIPERFK